MFFLTRANLKLADDNMVHDQVINIIVRLFTDCKNIYPLG